MASSRRGLVAPQNTFLDAVARKAAGHSKNPRCLPVYSLDDNFHYIGRVHVAGIGFVLIAITCETARSHICECDYVCALAPSGAHSSSTHPVEPDDATTVYASNAPRSSSNANTRAWCCSDCGP